MPSTVGSPLIVFAIMVFVAVLLLMEGFYLIWDTARGPTAVKLNRRLEVLSAARDRTVQAALIRQRLLSELPAVDRVLQRLPRLHALDRFIVQAGLDWSVSTVLLACAAFAAAGAVLAGTLDNAFVVRALAAVLLGALPLGYVNFMRVRRMRKLQRQLPETLDLIARALRAGHALPSAIKMAGDELAEPAGGEFRSVHDEVNFGVSLQQALGHLCDRVPLTDLRYFVVAVLIQRDSGGNLTEVLSNLSRLIRQRLRLLAQVRVLSSEGRISAWILVLLPFALAGLMYFFNPKFISVLWTDQAGIAITKTMIGMMLVGVILIRKIVQIRA
jgi:tight adherence protein B